MAYSNTKINVNRGTTGIVLTPEQSQEVWSTAQHESAVMTLGQRVALPGSGLSIDVITGDITADWTVESTEKHVSANTFSAKTMTPYKLAAIMLFSNELRRDKAALYDECIRRAPAAIGAKLDQTVFAGTAPGTGFDVLTSATAYAMTSGTAYDQLVTAMAAIGTAGGRMNGIVVSPQLEALLLQSKDGDSRPLFLPNVNDESAISRILGARVFETPHVYATGTPNVAGFVGDWSQLRYGIVEGIKMDISEEATINDGTNQINLWQRNMFAVRIEAEVGVVVGDGAAFGKLTIAA